YPYPALARKPYFDSAVVGTSTVRLLRPEKLNETLGGRFVNLSMDSATAYEQAELLAVFARNHPNARRILIGVDRVWCEVGDTLVKTTFRDFPEWLFDDNPWNDYVNLFNARALQDTYRTLRFAFGLRAGRFGPDGHANFLPPASEYDLAWAQRKIYGERGPRRREPSDGASRPSSEVRAAWHFPSHALMEQVLKALPAETEKVLFFVPYHHFTQGGPGSEKAARMEECKDRLTDTAARHPNAAVLDFMIPSRITLRDSNYWDPIHYTVEIADRLAALIAVGITNDCAVDGVMRHLSNEIATDAGGSVTLCELDTGTM
ncbi:MAG: hypothetical protein GY798_16795, partial [Hyphomicrobiales bacterium]|nr:hypothetical protein [Hyphomicrobiales bacterium]